MKLLAAFAALAVTTTAYAAPRPPSPRADEAIQACKRAVVSEAVNPESIDFDKTAWPGMVLGHGEGLNVTLYNVRGTNSYGAVVRRDWECKVKCAQDKPCYATRAVDQEPTLPEVLKVKPATQASAPREVMKPVTPFNPDDAKK